MLTSFEQMNDEEASFADNFFMEKVYPVLTPMAVDASRPFPLIRNKSLNIAALIKTKNQSEEEMEPELEFATVQVPSVMGRIVQLPCTEGVKLILLEEIIRRNISKLFLNYDVISTAAYRIERNADLSIDEEEAEDLLQEIEKQLKQRQWGEAIKLEVSEEIDKYLLKYLKKRASDNQTRKFIRSRDRSILHFNEALWNWKALMHLSSQSISHRVSSRLTRACPSLTTLKKGDIFLHHPYITFDPCCKTLFKEAAVDPKVLAIKQTLYRVSGNSPIVAALAKAAENGKQVTVLVELKARFDEEHNIVWAKMLEKAGCHVIYGLRGLKTHSKITLIVRDEEDGICRYVHLGTGNYNDATAKLYTDCGIMTCNRMIGEDATAVFNMLSGYSEPESWNQLAVAPLWLRGKFLSWIKRETEFAKSGRPAYIIAKMNSLCDKGIIAALYEASAAGVKIDLIIRGICCVKAGIPGVSENIRVRSIVGTFLEHSRIFCFGNGGNEEIYMGSADWMPRNLDRRVEITFPVLDPSVRAKVRHILEVELEDTVRARIMKMDESGQYERIDKRGKVLVDSQEVFCNEAEEQAFREDEGLQQQRVFEPLTAEDAQN